MKEIGSFVILTQAAVTGQTLNKGLSSLQPTITLDSPTFQNTIFPNALDSWTSEPVTVTRSKKSQGCHSRPTCSVTFSRRWACAIAAS